MSNQKFYIKWNEINYWIIWYMGIHQECLLQQKIIWYVLEDVNYTVINSIVYFVLTIINIILKLAD